MTKSVKMIMFAVLSVAFVYGMTMFVGCSGGGSSDNGGGGGGGGTTTYSGTLYMASEAGGHIGVYPVTIDPSNTTSPITVDTSASGRVQLTAAPRSGNQVIFHDVRFDDPSNPTRIYYSGIMSSGTDTGVTDIGYVDLANIGTPDASHVIGNSTDNGVNSVVDIDAPAADTIAFALGAMDSATFGSGSRIEYCASGMSSDYYFPMSMSFPAYVDAIPKTALEGGSKHVTSSTTGFERTYINQIDADAAGWERMINGGATNGVPNDLGTPPLAFIHGATSYDGTKVYIVTNQVAGLSPSQNLAGYIRAYLVNTSDLESAGSTTPGISSMDPSKVLSSASVTVRASDVSPVLGSIAYRASFTPDGTKILQAANDSMLIFNANDLSVYDDTYNDAVKVGGGKNGIEVHDVTTTQDGKYAILAIRYFADANQESAGKKTSGVQLYDINNKKFIGGITPTCGAVVTGCHQATGDFDTRPTCGVIFEQN